MIRRAVVWLCQQINKPILKLTNKDYNDFGLSELITQFGSAYNCNIKVFNDLQHTITGWPGGKPDADDTYRPERAKPYPKKVIVFSPHPDDDVISMGGTFIRLAEQGHDVHVAYQTSGNVAVHDDVVIQDLPGIYSLSPYTPEEVVTRAYLVDEHPDAILNIIDGTNIERNLYLTTQLIELGHPVVIAVNMIDLVRKNGDEIDLERRGRALGCVVMEISALKGEGCTEAAAKAVELARTGDFDLIILDLMMPEIDGLEACVRIREFSNVPIIMLTAKDETFDKVLGLELGADDYMVKPVDEEEMILRIAALLRRSRIVNEHRLEIGETVLDYDSLTVESPAGVMELPKKEFMLLFKLLSYPNKIFTRRQLMDEIWDMDSESDERTVDVHINRLRDRFRTNPDFEIVTVRGLGYKAVKRT